MAAYPQLAATRNDQSIYTHPSRTANYSSSHRSNCRISLGSSERDVGILTRLEIDFLVTLEFLHMSRDGWIDGADVDFQNLCALSFFHQHSSAVQT
jgi:hypothetical protein